MDGIGMTNAPFVIGLTTDGGKFLRLAAVEFDEGSSDGIARDKAGRVGDILEQATAHDLKALLGIGRSPGRLDAPKDTLESFGGFATAFAACFGIGSRNGCHQ